jgi:26S proteasome regulatory subunit N12
MSSINHLLESLQKQGTDAENSLLLLKLSIARGEISERELCRNILQAACALSIARRDKVGLERNLVQLKPYGTSHEMYALELLLLLVESRLSDFFALLETIDRSTASQHIDFVVNLERNLTEGSYHKALRARKDSTSPLFGWLLEDLEQTVRDEVASCIEVSHRSLKLQRAAELLKLDSIDATRRYSNTRDGWMIEGDRISFANRGQVKTLSKESIPAEWTIRECLNMAVELDRIV